MGGSVRFSNCHLSFVIAEASCCKIVRVIKNSIAGKPILPLCYFALQTFDFQIAIPIAIEADEALLAAVDGATMRIIADLIL